MAYTNTVKLTKETILNKVSQSQIFQYYLGYTPEEGKRYTNPLRRDNNPDCVFYVKDGKIKFKDFAGRLNEDCFGIVMLIHRCNYPVALEQIAKDFGLYGWSNKVPIFREESVLEEKKDKQRTRFTVRFRPWNLIDAKYWKQYYISRDILEIFNVRPVKIVWINDKEIPSYIYTDNDPCYAFMFPDKTVKLYFPFRSKDQTRFWNNSTYIQGYQVLPDRGENLILTKSFKDVMSLAMFNIPAIAPQAETAIVESELILSLKQRFNNIYVLYDWDRAGIAGALKIRKDYGIKPLFFTNTKKCNFLGAKVKIDFEEKDFTDNLKKYGIYDMIDIIEYTRIDLILKEITQQEIIPF